jgi:hypothetical protein
VDYPPLAAPPPPPVYEEMGCARFMLPMVGGEEVDGEDVFASQPGGEAG